MTLNYPGPLELRIFYTVTGMTHSQRLNLSSVAEPNPGDAFSSITVITQGAQAPTLAAYVDAYAALMDDVFDDNDTSIDYAELWKYPALSNDGTFINAYDISAAGTNAAATTKLAGEYILTFRTAEGGIMRMHYMEPTDGKAESVAYASLPTYYSNIVDFVLGAGGGFLGRDTSFPVAFIKGHPGENEALFRKRYRPT